jgi:kynurenine formamidase
LLEVAATQGVTLRSGDILCIRTGWVAGYRGLTAAERGSPELSSRFIGLRANDDMVRFLWDSGSAAVTIDNPGFECVPGRPEDGFLHRKLLPMLGFVIGELLDFEVLATVCAAIDRYEFQFVAVPLSIPGGLSSPANAIAVL